MTTEYEFILFSKDGTFENVILAEDSTVLSSLREQYKTLAGYYFLTKNNKIINMQSEKYYKISQIVRDNNKIHMSTKQGAAQPKNKQKQVTLIFSKDKKEVIRVLPTMTLESMVKDNLQILEGYEILNKDGNPIKASQYKNYTVQEVLQNNQITLKQATKKQKKVYTVEFMKSKAKKLSIMADQNDTLKDLRKNTELEGFNFVTKSGNPITSSSESSMKIKDISSSNIIYMIAKEKEEKKDAQAQAKLREDQKKRIQSINKMIKDLQPLKGDIKKGGDPQKMKAIADKLKEIGVQLKPNELPDEHKLSNLLTKLESDKKQSQEILDMAKKVPTSDAPLFESNGLLLPTIYKYDKKKQERARIVDFEKSIRQKNDELKKAYQLTIIEYETSTQSSVTSDISKKSEYEFKGGSIEVSAYFVSAKFEKGDASLSESEKVRATKSVRKNQTMSQLYLSFAITNAISFKQDGIFLKQKVVEEFEKIVEETKDNQILLKSRLYVFIDKYGIALKSSVYYLGGIFQNKINYQFLTEASSSEVTNIIRDETSSVLSVGAGGAYGPVSVNAAYTQQQKSKNETGSMEKETKSGTKYKISKYHEARPLNSIQNMLVWSSTMEAYPHNWVVVGTDHSQDMEIPIYNLLGYENNSFNTSPEFLIHKNKALKMMKFCIKNTPLILGEHSKFEISEQIQVKKIGDQYLDTQLTSTQPFPTEGMSSFSVQVIKSSTMEIAIGICGKSCLKNQYSRPEIHEVIYYRLAGKGSIIKRFNKQDVGITVKEGSIIHVKIETGNFSEISWEVDGVRAGQAMIPAEMVNEGIYAYFEVFKKGDVIKIL